MKSVLYEELVEMEKFYEDLNHFLQEDDQENLLLLLESLDKDKSNIHLSNTSPIKSLLKYRNNDISLKATELIAECAKDEKNRLLLSEKETIQLLVNLLESDDSIVFNTARALGNIFYENEDATKLLDENDFEKILKKLYDFEGDNLLLLSKISGLILNIFMSNGDLHFIDKERLLKCISEMIERQPHSYNKEISHYSYLLQLIYTLMVEYEDQIIYSESLHKIIIDVLKNSCIPELELLCLQLLYNASEKDNVQLLLAESNVCQKIFELVEKYKGLITDEESRSILKMACDLINNILIEDRSMALLYDGGKGDVYINCIKWLDSEDVDLLATAIMAIGNFARNDENCIAIVKTGAAKKLIELLPKYCSKDPNIKLLHGLLSSLKNLVVPKVNKSLILEEGLLHSIEPILKMDEDIVIFKLLGTLRLVIDGQETAARTLISKSSFLENLTKWHNSTHHLGVKLEVSRLLAWLIKSCHSWISMQDIIKTDGPVICLISMFSSEDVIMENEALFSLNLLVTSLMQSGDIDGVENLNLTSNKDKFIEQLVKADLATVIPYIRIFSHSEQMLENLIGLLDRLFKFEGVLKHFKEKKALETINEHSDIIKSKNCFEKIQQLISILSS